MSLLRAVIFTILFASAFAVVIDIWPCDETKADICEVTEARIVPCKNRHKCVLTKGTDVSLSFDFIPNFTADKLNTTVYWASVQDVEFSGFGSNDACLYTSCPTVAGQSQTFTYTLHVNKKFPQGSFPLKWFVRNSANPEELCCFRLNISLRGKK